MITQERIDQALTYQEYRDLLNELMANGHTTGHNHSEEMLGYTKMNIQRMNRLDKTVVLEQELIDTLASISTRQYWLVLTEGWCGDASQIVPVIAKMADVNPAHIELRILLRDENLDIMDQYLTNDGRAIPKIVLLEADNLQEISHWGPRPAVAHDLYWSLRNEGKPYADISTSLHAWYAKDKTKAIQSEWMALLQSVATV